MAHAFGWLDSASAISHLLFVARTSIHASLFSRAGGFSAAQKFKLGMLGSPTQDVAITDAASREPLIISCLLIVKMNSARPGKI